MFSGFNKTIKSSGFVDTAAMNSTWKVLVLAVICAVAWADLDPQLDKHWEMWKMAYNKKYLNKVEEVNRRAIWEKNLQYINTHNLEASLQLHTYTLAMNHIGDLTKEEALQMYANLRVPKEVLERTSAPFKATNVDVPDAMDWRQKNCVTSVKDQGECGSCWAFSVVGSMEGFLARTTGQLVDLSPQQLVDCAKNGNYGCQGGLMDKAFEYVKTYGLETEANYPYHAEDGQCKYSAAKRRANCTAYRQVSRGDEDALKVAVATYGPISIGINADPIIYYSSGIFSDKDCTEELNHGVVAVGYGTENGKPFWLVKNSWGGGWGEKGYIRIARNDGNMCGIATYANYCYI